MKSMLAAFVAMIVIAFAAEAALERMGFSAQDTNTSSAVRLDDASE